VRPSPSPRDGLIPITGGTTARPSSSGDPYAYWSNYFKKHDETPNQLHETVRLLNASGKVKEVHAALLGYLQNRPRNAEFWMYEALALAIEMNGGKPEDVHKALDAAADMAQRTHNPNHLVSVADKLLLKGHTERVGALLDEATEKVPHRAEPVLMSMMLAQKVRDPRRMADSIERLLSLGWPGQDDYFRAEASRYAGALAAALKEEGRGEEAQELTAALTASESRDLYIRLTWDGNADYDLIVEEPLGATVSRDMPRSVFGGALVKDGKGSRPEEVYVCPRGFDGDYVLRIMPIADDPAKPSTRLTLEVVSHDGREGQQTKAHSLTPNDPNAKPVVVSLKGGRRTRVLPFVSPTAVRDAVQEVLEERAEKARSRKGAEPEKPEATPRTAAPIR
jgi:hypothetical protein